MPDSLRSKVRDTLTKVASEYPAGDLRSAQMADIDRIAFHVTLVLSWGCKAVCDIGGGIGMFSVGCAAMGMNATLVDDFRDAVNLHYGDDVLKLHRAHGVTVISRDVIAEGVPGQLGPVLEFCIACWHFVT